MVRDPDHLRDTLMSQLQFAGTPVSAVKSATFTTLWSDAERAGASEVVLAEMLATAVEVSLARSLADYGTSSEFTAKIPIAFARKHRLIGLNSPDREATSLLLAIADPAGINAAHTVSRFLNRNVELLVAPAGVVLDAINQAYQQHAAPAQAFIDTLDRQTVLGEVQRLIGRDDLLDNAARAPVIKLINLVLFEAVKLSASDIHVQPYEDRLMIRMRIDGVLYDNYTLPKQIQDECISRIKVMGRMNIAEKRLPQDGRATVQVGDRNIDLRIASLPTSFGERVVIRLLDKSARLYALGELGMDPRTLAGFEKLIAAEHGLVLVTGPTGSGKSTTLYSALVQINSKERNILTLEDPIEYQLEGISQTQVSDKKGMTFAKGLRSVLRQDPDVIMVGEIRDLETATMAIQSALTGHLVFSTLHTNDAASAVTRLLDLGIEPYLVASSLVGVLAQRLVRRICPTCGIAYQPDAGELRWLGVSQSAAESMRNIVGCEACRNTGYRGRLGAFELLALNDDLRRMIGTRATAGEIKAAAVRGGMDALRNDGVQKILRGVTTIAEVERVTMRSDESSRDTLPLSADTPTVR